MVQGRLLSTHNLYATFLTDIATGYIRPGERLGEQSLAARWKVGRVPVRETLLRLEQDGLVERRPNSGTYVLELKERDILELYDVRIGIEPLIAAEAAQNITKTQSVKLAELAKEADHLVGDGLLRAARDRAFHAKLCEISKLRHSPRIITLARMHLRCSTIYQRVRILGTYTISQPDHRPIAAAVIARNGSRAASLMREHLESAKKAVVKDIREMQKQFKKARADAAATPREHAAR